MQAVVERLLQSDEPAVRFKAWVSLPGNDPYSDEGQRRRDEIVDSPRVDALLAEIGADGRLPGHPYRKWDGAHWVLAVLADLHYPPGDETLEPLRDQVYEWLLSKKHLNSVQVIDGRARRCASQEGNALFSTLALGLADDRAAQLADNLMRWQWPDGGWNCDKNPFADSSSFMETLIPMRALALFGRLTGETKAAQAANRAAEVFLSRNLFRKKSDGSIIYPYWLRLHYPCYFEYDILFALKVMVEAGFIQDSRCQEALDVLEGKRLPDGGFPAEEKFYRVSHTGPSRRSPVDWGGVDRNRMNEFVTAEALGVLQAAGRG
jgi:hypothetical protein